MKSSIVIAIAVVVLVIGAGGGFFAGMKYQQSKQPSFNFQQNNGATRGLFRSGANGAGANASAVTGNIISASADSITVQLADGSSKIVLISPSTTLEKGATASASDLQTGERVAAFGTTNSDGSVTATNVQINPVMRTQPRQ
ncbi:MAG: DUF5666 domain-containing protein [Patescibacteria group bacterium]|nr:DUF5666 domain-containing protein [Patescibacteria group bacterium]MCL5431643.1 DUF5666 domain-containing protein [Patescibacteria group bacterium]